MKCSSLTGLWAFVLVACSAPVFALPEASKDIERRAQPPAGNLQRLFKLAIIPAIDCLSLQTSNQYELTRWLGGGFTGYTQSTMAKGGNFSITSEGWLANSAKFSDGSGEVVYYKDSLAKVLNGSPSQTSSINFRTPLSQMNSPYKTDDLQGRFSTAPKNGDSILVFTNPSFPLLLGQGKFCTGNGVSQSVAAYVNNVVPYTGCIRVQLVVVYI
ncbi:hypothetical protein PVAG01_01264 [Phlyctema vagabunda]|uniref:Uncharacterized protein n=1 Tax=Phlyctema vagabunda TaxID=108571 RepID=A0ABR4PWL1_9HELO